MHPILFEIGNASVSGFSFMLGLAFVMCTAIAIGVCKRQIISINNIFGLIVSIQISGLLGSRLLFVMNNYSQFESDLWKIFSPAPGGFAFTGGLFLSVLAAIIYIKLAKLSFWKISDCAVYPIAAGIFLTKIGCFLGGCCYGKETSFVFGVQFPADSLAAQKFGFPHLVHPTQLYEAFSSIIILAVTILYVRKNRKFDGQLFLSFIILYLITRTLNESIRGDVAHNLILKLSQTQFLSIIFIFIAIFVFWIKLQASKSKI